jgi:hypothetical protein
MASQPTIYRKKDELCRKGWLESNKKGGFKTTEQGLLELAKNLGEAPQGLVQFYPPLLKVPTEFHVAIIELVIASIIARLNDIRQDKFLSILILGRTLKWKTSAAKFICIMLALDIAATIVSVASEFGKSLWLRKNSTGGISTKRNLLGSLLVVFDDVQNATLETKKIVKLYTDGRKTVPYENDTLSIQATSLLTMNPLKGETVEERSGLETSEIRRHFICDLDKVDIPDLAVRGEEALEAARQYGPLALPKPQGNCSKYRLKIIEFFSRTLTDTGRGLVDIDSIVMLSTAFTSFLSEEEAVRRILYDSLLLYQTLDWALPDWKLQLKEFPETVSKDPVITGLETTEIALADKSTEAFKLLKSRASPVDLVIKLRCTIEQANKFARAFYDLETMAPKELVEGTSVQEPNEVTQLKHDVEIAALKKEKRQLEEPFEIDDRIRALNDPLEAHGRWNQENCSHLTNTHCRKWQYEGKPAVSYQDGEPIQVGKCWFIHPTYLRCATCSQFNEKNTATKQQLEERLAADRKDIIECKNMFNIITAVRDSIDPMGGYKKERCIHFQQGYCRFYDWDSPSNTIMLGKPLPMNSKCLINPIKFICALCSKFKDVKDQQ